MQFTPIQLAILDSELREFSRMLVLAWENASYPLRLFADALANNPEIQKLIEAKKTE